MRLLLLILFLNMYSFAMSQGGYQAGEKVFDHKIHLIGAKKPLTFSQVRNGRAIIVDFWGIWCKPCIEAMPKLDSLKRLFNGKLEVLAIASEEEQKLKKFIQNNPLLKDLTITFAIDSAGSLFKSFLPIGNAYPAELWIDNKGIVRGRMETATVEDARELVFNGRLTGKNNRQPLAVDVSKGPFPTFDTGFLYRSVFEKANLNVKPASYLLPDINNKIRRAYFSRASIKALYHYAAFGYTIPQTQIGRCVVELDDSIQFRRPKIGSEEWIRSGYKTMADWEADHTFIYELIMPEPVDGMQFLNEYMLNDLNRVLNVKGTIEMREMPAYLIVNKTKENPFLKRSELESKWRMDSIIDGKRQTVITGIQAKTLDEIADMLNRNNYGDIPILNATGYTEPIDMDFIKEIGSYTNVAALRIFFQKYGLDIVEGTGRTKAIVIRNK